MSASGQPMEMKATVSFVIDRNSGCEAAFETTFVIDDPDDAGARGQQMTQAITAFIEGYGAGTE